MLMQTLAETMFSLLEKQGCRGRIVSIAHLHELQEEISAGHREARFPEELYREWLAGLTVATPERLPEACSLIVVAIPQAATRVTFAWQGKQYRAIVPPTYARAAETRRAIGEMLAQVLGPAGYHVDLAALPLKLLAVRSGLGAYGRNNICYVPGLGSFHRLAGFYSDMPAADVGWREPAMLKRCARCRACLRRCPGGAITEERFLIHAERCLTFHNESRHDFPAWIDPAWHHCLVGCLRCQTICPENKGLLRYVEAEETFGEDETVLLLAGVPQEKLPAAMVEKLQRLDLLEYLAVLPRNLRALLPAQG